MRLGLVMIVLTACASAPPAGPSWPKLSPRAADGGESIAPREAARAFAAIEEDKPDRTETDGPAASSAETPSETGAADKPAATTPAGDPSTDEILMTEEIVIEVDGSP
jgi:hypothetical protein